MNQEWWKSQYYKFFSDNDLRKLEKLHMKDELNWVNNFRASYFLRNVTNETELMKFQQLSRNINRLCLKDAHCSILSPSIVYLKNLTELYVYNYQLAIIPEYLIELKQLHKLFIQRCPIEKIPDWISEMRKLIVLNVSRCRVREVTARLAKLQNLKELILCRNQLKDFPFSLPLNLEFLDVSHNPLLDVPISHLKIKTVELEGTKTKI